MPSDIPVPEMERLIGLALSRQLARRRLFDIDGAHFVEPARQLFRQLGLAECTQRGDDLGRVRLGRAQPGAQGPQLERALGLGYRFLGRRDRTELEEVGFPVFHLGASPLKPAKDGPAELRVFVLHHHLLPVPGTGRERNIVNDAGVKTLADQLTLFKDRGLASDTSIWIDHDSESGSGGRPNTRRSPPR